MPIYAVGSTDIEYELERRSSIERRYIEVTPNRVLVIVSDQDNDEDVQGFLARKEQWLFDNTQKINGLVSKGNRVHRFVTGVKVPYRGRRMKLTIARKTTPDVDVSFRYGFVVSLPDYVKSDAQDCIVGDALKFWMKRKVKSDVRLIVERYKRKYGLCPKAVRVKDQKHMWGSCSKDGTININWHLVYAPRPVLEYAVLHELCHLKHRTHDSAFWGLVGRLMPDYEVRKSWLDKNEHMMGYVLAS